MDREFLDSKDERILKVLINDARASIREISNTTGIRPSTVHQRIKRLVEDDVIEKFTVKLNDEKVGEGFTVYMLISGCFPIYPLLTASTHRVPLRLREIDLSTHMVCKRQ